MRYILTIALPLLLAACAHSDKTAGASESSDVTVVTYYDRNLDGIADFELHEPPYCDDCIWALVDFDFDGRYERRVNWSFSIIKESVNLPVPGDVNLVPGNPKLRGWE
jgi:hypothetical protein